ncbi:IucA/IucC family protein [Actinocrinis sp.]|uniref:IucA/IucC family protein n=1 Tax=Actinocrinis sp. TaxID=1920516 RepID=UPI002D42FD96|nr:IucA/IucC family protein [Actinocrinis sp.]HZP50937.1 IucA/IucC family protein [Actinocrinis sp.]
MIPTSQLSPPDAPTVPGAVPTPDRPADATTFQRAGNRLATEALLRCWIRERRVQPPAEGEPLVIDLGGSVLRIPVEYWSPAGMHRLGTAAGPLGPLSPGGLARLLGESAGASGQGLEQLVQRAVESAERVGAHLEARAASPAPTEPVTPFLVAEQGLLAGHPLHPTPKSRDALSATEAARYSPELRGSFPLHWFAVAPDLAAHDSELGPTTPDLATFLSGLTPDDRVLVPAHPWQANALLRRDNVRELIASGRLEHLGEAGPAWYPTSSLRTVYRPDQPVMLKLSLALRITNSRRENLRKELLRGVEAHRLLSGRLGMQLLTAHPGFRALTDAGYLAVDGVPGLDVSFRHSPFRPRDHVFCLAALTDLGRGAVAADGHPHELAAHLHSLSAAEQRPVRAVALEWFARYLTALITPLLWLDAEHGVTLEAHQQNTLIQLDAAGYPGAGWYRDNQGFYYRRSRIAHLEAFSGISALGQASETIVDDDVVTERLLYYVGINNLMGVVGALGCAGIAPERDLLGLAADLLAPLRGHQPVDLLLGAKSLRCKANLLTRAADLDELIGDLATQSVYVEIANPIAGLARDNGTGAMQGDAA